ncbi:NUDIX domain-containing protein [Agromyces sp. MMS24-JH15]|uniref:NUDIX domain-containing protein n=1 Tax=Agromyces sp. MMS24-JH15 TaxID=3243765 RepID=UPI003748D03A
MAWPVRSSRTVYENPWIVVTEDLVTRPDGAEGVYGVLEVRHTAVFVVAVTDRDEVLLVTVDRHTVGTSIEVPAGGTDGEDPLVAARRELLEETGYEASDWREIGRMSALNGISRAPEVVYLATGLQRSADAAHHQGEEGISEVRAVPWSETIAMVRDGRIDDGETVAALAYAAIALGRLG